ncbi:GTP cyclohydrolase, partial [Vibrio sp. M260118]
MNAATEIIKKDIQVSKNMAEVRARVDFKVGAKSNIDA